MKQMINYFILFMKEEKSKDLTDTDMLTDVEFIRKIQQNYKLNSSFLFIN